MANRITVSGSIIGNPEFEYELFNIKFYKFFIGSERHSGIIDVLPCIIPDRLINEIRENYKIVLYGEVRTRRLYNDEKRHTDLYIYVDSVSEYYGCDFNGLELTGEIQTEPIFRKTPLGKEITDFLIKSNRKKAYKRLDYIPCITWHENAHVVKKLEKGTKVSIFGRLQSREYIKKIDDETEKKMVTYEVSVGTLEVLGGNLFEQLVKNVK